MGVPAFADDPGIDFELVLSAADEHKREEKVKEVFDAYFEDHYLKVEGERTVVTRNDEYTIVGRDFTEGDVYAVITILVVEKQLLEQAVKRITIQYIDFENDIMIDHIAEYDWDSDVSINRSMDDLIDALEALTASDMPGILEEGERHVS